MSVTVKFGNTGGDSEKDKSGIIDITTGWITVNSNCNSRCKWCYLGELVAQPSRYADLQMVKRAIDFYKELGIVSLVLMGGEPTLYPGLQDVVRHASLRNIPELTVVTNGRRLYDQDYASALAKAGLDIFSITIHSTKKDLHDLISGRKAAHHAFAGVKNAVKTGKKCFINLVVSKDNIGDVEESIPVFLNDWGVANVTVSCANPSVIGDKVDGTESLHPDRFAELVVRLAHFPKEVKILLELPLCIIPEPILIKLLKEQRLGFGCHVGLGSGIILDIDGDILPCNSFPGHKMIKLFDGDRVLYSPEEFLKVWSLDPEFREFRREVNVYRSDKCVECGIWQICNSGCPIVYGHYEPDEIIKGIPMSMTLVRVQSLLKGGDI